MNTRWTYYLMISQKTSMMTTEIGYAAQMTVYSVSEILAHASVFLGRSFAIGAKAVLHIDQCEGGRFI